MPSKPTLETLAKQEQSLRDKITRLEKDLRALKDVLNIHDNWNAAVRLLIGHRVRLKIGHSGSTLLDDGILKWADRYNLSLEISDSSGKHDRIYNKGHIIWIEPA